MNKTIFILLAIFISLPVMASENYYGTFDGVKYDFYVNDRNVWGSQGGDRFDIYINDRNIWGQHLDGKRIDVYSNERNIWGTTLCGRIDIYFNMNSENIWGTNCQGRFDDYVSDRSEVKFRVQRIIGRDILRGFIRPVRRQMRKLLRAKWTKLFSALNQ